MAESFDPYYKWLGISPQEQPPNHYRLLAINLFETDPDVIEAAADRQMSHLRGYQTGPHSAESQKLLNECATARVTLLAPQKKAEYDGQLRERLSAASSVGNDPSGVLPGVAAPIPGASPRTSPLPQPQPSPVTKSAPVIDVGASPPLGRLSAQQRKKNSSWLLPAASIGGAMALALVMWVTLRPSGWSDLKNREASTIASDRRKTAVSDSAPKQSTATPAGKTAVPPPSVATLTPPAMSDSAIAANSTRDESNGAAPDDSSSHNRADDKNFNLTLASGVTMRLVKIPASADGKIKSFYLGQTEVTQKQWQAVMANNPSSPKEDQLPVTNVVFDEAATFCERVQERTSGLIVRLPSYEEQQHAQFVGFAGDQRPHLEDFAWLKSESPNGMHAVATKRADALGLYDMFGNVNEWCEGGKRIAGGNWSDPLEPLDARQIRVFADVWKLAPNWHDNNCGLRIAANTDAAKKPAQMANRVEPDAESSKRRLDITLEPGVTMRLVKIPASADGKIKPFYLGETEVTQKQWVAVMGSNPASHKGDDRPVENLDQGACIDFCAALGRVAKGVSFRLPSEAEWMHAYKCNADTTAVYPAAQKFCGWSRYNCDSPQPVGKLPANPYGLFDMVGNVHEWTAAKAIVYGGSYEDKPEVQSVKYGGCVSVPPTFKRGNTGFRVAAEAIKDQETTSPLTLSDLASETPAKPPSPAELVNKPAVDARRAVPQGKELAAAEKQVADTYDSQWKTAKKLPERLALARKMYDDGVQTPGNLVLRYALLREAERRATELGDAATACDAIDQLSRDFQVDALAEKLTASGDALKKAQAPAQVWTLALRVLVLADRALMAEQYDEARKLVALITLAGRRLRRNDLTKYAERRLALVRTRGDWHNRLENALARLQEQPDDPAANLTGGVGLCQLRGDWQRGLPLLERSDEKRMVEIARLEAAAGQDVATRPALVDAWMAAATKQTGDMRTEYELQAKYWLDRGLPEQAPADSAHKRTLDKLTAMTGVSLARLRPGLDMAMYNGTDFQQFRARRVAQGICHDFGFDGPHPSVSVDGFSVRWTGWLKPPLPGKYVIQTHSDDGCRLRINGNLLIDHWHRGSGEERAEVDLTDEIQPFSVEFNDTGATAGIRVAWALKDLCDFQLIPAEAFYFDPANNGASQEK